MATEPERTNQTGVVVGRLSKDDIREILLEASNLSKNLKEKLLRWFEFASKTDRQFVISEPLRNDLLKEE